MQHLQPPDGVRVVTPGQKPKRNTWKDRFPFAAVGPLGQFTITFVDKNLLAKGEEVRQGDVPVVLREGSVFVPGAYKRAGWVLYKDLCLGETKAEASPRHWELWSRFVDMMAAGKRPQRGALEATAKKMGLGGFFHPQVYELRERAKHGGVDALDVDGLIDWLGLDVADVDASAPKD